MFSSKICNIKKVNKIGEIRWKVEGIERGKEKKKKDMESRLSAELAIIKISYFSILTNNVIF